uniref:Arginine vasopressin-induced protein 1 n=1 Tax=Sphaeramia orbicularis TaxID=375764 RepID=A0A673CT98_9TELE
MDTRPASPPSSVMAGPPALWRLAERRSRKAGSGNIFSNVNPWQLQRLFRAAGDQDAEQRAQLVWGHGDEAELAQALIGLRARKTVLSVERIKWFLRHHILMVQIIWENTGTAVFLLQGLL